MNDRQNSVYGKLHEQILELNYIINLKLDLTVPSIMSSIYLQIFVRRLLSEREKSSDE
jgi:hypothetical protein